jgi:hypothetical protein
MTSTTPAACAGEIAVIDVSELTMKLVAGTVPKLTAVAPRKFDPTTVMGAPPAVLPPLVPRPLTSQVNVCAAVHELADASTVTLYGPAADAPTATVPVMAPVDVLIFSPAGSPTAA